MYCNVQYTVQLIRLQVHTVGCLVVRVLWNNLLFRDVCIHFGFFRLNCFRSERLRWPRLTRSSGRATLTSNTSLKERYPESQKGGEPLSNKYAVNHAYKDNNVHSIAS